jgi:hypothetical protein
LTQTWNIYIYIYKESDLNYFHSTSVLLPLCRISTSVLLDVGADLGATRHGSLRYPSVLLPSYLHLLCQTHTHTHTPTNLNPTKEFANKVDPHSCVFWVVCAHIYIYMYIYIYIYKKHVYIQCPGVRPQTVNCPPGGLVDNCLLILSCPPGG